MISSEYTFSNDFYYNALLDANLTGLEHIYAEFRQPVIRAITNAGGTSADAGVFFRAALQETAALYRKQKEQQSEDQEAHTDPSDATIHVTEAEDDKEEHHTTSENGRPPFFQQIKALALGHYYDWLTERSQKTLQQTETPEHDETTKPPNDEISEKYAYSYTSEYEAGIKSSTTEEDATGAAETEEKTPDEAEDNSNNLLLPDSENMRLTRSKIFAWKKIDLLPEKVRAELKRIVVEQNRLPLEDETVKKYMEALRIKPDDAGADFPDWAMAALTDSKGYELWQKMQVIERKISAGLPVIEPPRRIQRTEYIARLVFGALLLGCIAWIFWPRGSEQAKEVYKDVFAPPESIMADLERRYGPDLAFDSVTVRPPLCTEILRQADDDYKKKNYSGALYTIGDLYENGDLLCQSDALFYMGVIFLQLEEPNKTIACFAKIEDLERYGEDLYWYQALAFVKKAELDPDKVKIARKAVKQAIANTQNPERREQGEKMLLKLMATTSE